MRAVKRNPLVSQSENLMAKAYPLAFSCYYLAPGIVRDSLFVVRRRVVAVKVALVAATTATSQQIHY